jgi:hypothetical protein
LIHENKSRFDFGLDRPVCDSPHPEFRTGGFEVLFLEHFRAAVYSCLSCFLLWVSGRLLDREDGKEKGPKGPFSDFDREPAEAAALKNGRPKGRLSPS